MSNYGCHNKPAQSPDAMYLAQAGWTPDYQPQYAVTVRRQIWVEIKSAFGTIGCQYKESVTDPDCKGCWQARESV